MISLNRHIIEDEHEDIPSKGKRTTPAPMFCYIDFNKYSVETSLSEPITSYEIWDIDGNYIYASFSDEVTFVQYLAEARGAYQIRFVTMNYLCIGFINF